MPTPIDPSRRRFLVTLAGSAVVIGGCSSSAAGPAQVGTVDAGNVSDLAPGTLRAVGSDPVAIGRDAKGVYAMTLTCTHEACNMATQGSVTAQAVDCACHGSRFDADGNVVRGPANAPLQHFAVTVDGSGNLTIHGDQPVDASTRLAV